MTDALMPETEPCAWCGEIVDERQIINGHCYLCRMTERPQPGKAEGWVACSARMPEPFQRVLVSTGSGRWRDDWYDSAHERWNGLKPGMPPTAEPTHWLMIAPVEPGRGGEAQP